MSTYSSASRSKQKSTSVRSNAGVVTVARKYSGQRSESVTVFDKARIKEVRSKFEVVRNFHIGGHRPFSDPKGGVVVGSIGGWRTIISMGWGEGKEPHGSAHYRA